MSTLTPGTPFSSSTRNHPSQTEEVTPGHRVTFTPETFCGGKVTLPYLFSKYLNTKQYFTLLSTFFLRKFVRNGQNKQNKTIKKPGHMWCSGALMQDKIAG